MEINSSKLFIRIVAKYHIEQHINSVIISPVCVCQNEARCVRTTIDCIGHWVEIASVHKFRHPVIAKTLNIDNY